MAITKEVKNDKIEIVTDYKNIQVRVQTTIKEDDVVISQSYTKTEILALMDEAHWDDMFAKKHNVYKNPPAVDTVDNSFDVSTLNDS